ncbi:MAG: YihY/virulence factor BrkB family protein [Paludibacteraceae bacterium]|nr:YihY/virulence factor BrkB family protein [Paludibacteraceae bacterium]
MSLKNFFSTDVWRVTGADVTGRAKAGYATMQTIILTARGFGAKRINLLANGLTYSLLFAIVPILAMILAIAKGFGFEAMIEEKLTASFLGEMNLVPTIMGFVQRYLDTAQGGAFIGIGLIILICAVYFFFRNVEIAFNGIWNVKGVRQIGKQLTNYICILFLIPVLIVVTSGLSIFLNSAASALQEVEILRNMQTWLVKVVSYAFICLVFVWMYWAIPNTKVRLIPALIPGILIGTLFQLLQSLSVYIIVFLSRTSIVYGAFASIPLMLMWLQWSSILILVGAQISYSIQNKEDFEYEDDLNFMSRRYKDCIMLFLLNVIIDRFNKDESPMTAKELAHTYHLPIRLVSRLLSRMEDVKVLRAVFVEGKEERTYQPAMDTHIITVGMIFERIDSQGAEQFLVHAPRELQEFWTRFAEMKHKHNSLNDILVIDL